MFGAQLSRKSALTLNTMTAEAERCLRAKGHITLSPPHQVRDDEDRPIGYGQTLSLPDGHTILLREPFTWVSNSAPPVYYSGTITVDYPPEHLTIFTAVQSRRDMRKFLAETLK